LYGQVLETVRYGEKRSAAPREEILNHLKDLTNESDIVSGLLSTAELAASNGAEPRFPSKDISVLSSERHLVGQFLEHFYRSANNFINFLDNTGSIPEPLQNLRIARFWLQHGVERATLGEPIPIEHPSDFPYQRGEDGYYTIPGSGKHIIIVGDERGPRTFDMLNAGNQVTHVEFDNSRMRITQRLMEMKVQRAKDSGQWRLELPDGAQFRSRISEAEPADYVEAYFPILFDALKPRGDSRRMEQLRELIVTNLAIKLNPEGSVFVISNRHDAIEDLARAVQQYPNFDLLELQTIRDRMPLRAGMHVTAVEGENLYSWLVFRNRGD
ncbi:MAG TPA: hypothetical protein VJP40_08770, partial [bacterium]|nr:hypothetical protein [bacterium]